MNKTTTLFIFGITPRSGTNYLFDLLRLHPDVEIRIPILEDHILSKIDPLIRFAANVTGFWREVYKLDEREARRFIELLGDGIDTFLTNGSSARYVMVKTPWPVNVDLVPSIFPRSPVVLIVRDGRSVCESTRLSWDTSIEETTQRWAYNGRLIYDFLDRYGKDRVPYLLVRYEDLVANTEEEMRRLLEALDLDATCYDFAAASSLPVRGSSVLRGDASRLHWNPVPKSPDFDPLRRHDDWDQASLDRFAAAADDVLEAFGYNAKSPAEPSRQT